MLKFKLNLILPFVSYKVIMTRNIFLDHPPLFCPHKGFFINPLALTLLSIIEWLSARTVIWLKQLTLSYSIIRFLNVFGGDAILAACYLINRMPSSVLHEKIPHSIIFPNQPLFCLPPRVFGCVCFVHILTPAQDKLLAKATMSLLMSHFLRTLLSTLLVLMSYLYPLFIPS